MFDPHSVAPKDAPKNNTVLTDDGNTIHFRRKDPFGFIYLELETGEMPPKYQGAYTTMMIAERDAQSYIEDRRLALKEVKKR